MRGQLQIRVEGTRAGRIVSIDLASLAASPGAVPLSFAFRYFQDVGADLRVPGGFHAATGRDPDPARHQRGEGQRRVVPLVGTQSVERTRHEASAAPASAGRHGNPGRRRSRLQQLPHGDRPLLPRSAGGDGPAARDRCGWRLASIAAIASMPASQERALDCLARFGERLRNMRAGRVRVVGTNTLRKARRAERFREQAARALGHPVEVISGIEEARLIYLGVSHSLPKARGTQMVVDIGGGSTEIIQGRGLEPETMESLYIGCVSLSASAFPGGKLSAAEFPRGAAGRSPGDRAGAGALPEARVDARCGCVRHDPRDLRRADVPRPGAQGHHRQGSGVPRRSHDRQRQRARPATCRDCPTIGRTCSPAASQSSSRCWPRSTSTGWWWPMEPCGRASSTTWSGGSPMRMRGCAPFARCRRRFRVDARQARRVVDTSLALWQQVADSWDLHRDADRKHAGLGRRAARARARHRACPLPPPRRVPARERRHAGLRARRAAGAGRHRPLLIAASSARSSSPSCRGSGGCAPCGSRCCCAWRCSSTGAGTRSRCPRCVLTAAGPRLELSLPARWLRDNPLTQADLEQECRYLAGAGLSLRIIREPRSRTAGPPAALTFSRQLAQQRRLRRLGRFVAGRMQQLVAAVGPQFPGLGCCR